MRTRETPEQKRERDQRYYDQNGRPHGKRRWTQAEETLLDSENMTDVEIAKRLGRSVHAVDNRRYKVNQRRRANEGR